MGCTHLLFSWLDNKLLTLCSSQVKPPGEAPGGLPAVAEVKQACIFILCTCNKHFSVPLPPHANWLHILNGADSKS